ncbi:MAG: LacI family DNA-binding transcriptional regulator [Oscillibacter sp.]|jgi:LacI family transcriptional regulator|nr:LacI family DNA-binding transcriptional regulator [Oscillibacter sp.]
MAVTAKEIAEKLGISPAAVSLAMNGKPGVSAATRERIIAEAVRMGYAIQKEASPAANIRYVIFLERGDAVKETSFYSIVLQGIEARAKKLGYNVFISYFYADGNWEDQVTSICSDVSGLILLGTEVTDRHIRKVQEGDFAKQNIPMVMVDNTTDLTDIDCVVGDNQGGAYKAVSYLLKKGHPDVGYLRSTTRVGSFEARELGVRKARLDAGLGGQTPLQCVDVSISSEQAFYDMSAWLSHGGKPLSAFFADNDIIAASCIRALKASGYHVPDDVSVIGFDDMPICTMVDPPLSTVHISKELIGQLSVDILHRRINDGTHNLADKRTDVFHTTVSTHLVKRESVANFYK